MIRCHDLPLLLTAFLSLVLSGSGAPGQVPLPPLDEDKSAGVGLALRADDAGLLITSVLPRGPADRAGLRQGERIVAVDGRATTKLPFQEASDLLPGKPGSHVTLTIMSDARPQRHVRIRREAIDWRNLNEEQRDSPAVAAAQPQRDADAAFKLRLLQKQKKLQSVLAQGDADTAFALRLAANLDRLREPFALEIRFMAKVCQLTTEQVESLKAAGQTAIEQQLMPTRGGVAGRLVRYEVVIVNGMAQVREVLNEPPRQTVRKALAPVLTTISREAGEKLDAEIERLKQRRQHADVLVQVTAFDEALLLTGEQREKLRDLLSTMWTDVWRGRVSDNEVTGPAQLCTSAASAMDLFSIPDVQLQMILRSGQIDAFKLVQLPTKFVNIFVEDAVPADRAALNPPAGNGGERAARRAPNLQPRPLIVRRLVRHGLPLKEERQHVEAILNALVDDAETHCALDAAQKQKLLLAGRLDLERHIQELTRLEQKAPGQVRLVEQRQIAGSKIPRPTLFSDSASMFQKALHRRLSPQQLEKLAEGERQRVRFRQSAVLAQLTVTISDTASLTDKQAEQVHRVFVEYLAGSRNDDDPANWCEATLGRLAELRPGMIEPLLEAWQLPAAREYLKDLASTARGLAGQPNDGNPLPVDPE
jgi:hypothetical protein